MNLATILSRPEYRVEVCRYDFILLRLTAEIR